ncbi:Toxin MazF [Magnetospirillum sp. LM-5]|uniref:type II toxin-antitoxin system PemK/MazF family toxin n=1 Tax=Magnetospirillum sp. LM-5 TaxID=2681466 RepID=UPI0013800096|nr:type II toxin-antitoxin system PemK/MazF family toxin [Magnetospirillum sp. LM-5]CAA7615159.1 Toxin MazF [Magnetospirillum sp. LM-5]
MKRGDVVTVAAAGDYGKPRPAVIVQSDWLDETDSVLVCLVTSTMRDAPLYRLSLLPTDSTGLRQPSQVMIDKVLAVRRDRCGAVIGRLGEADLAAMSRLLALVVGLAD